ncbi:DNA polymerase III subunit delta [Alkalilimnicola sp. S0819]|uniref:DNA polymerase III subunit delta n=1 Tax=Alkalilimnicola sp. S0819 TaxID=2613922 RepID=UPI0012619864|nr:DNA polymerase III subunit delta [Alkalilimnicola sp. S0819]KAB7628264.1 DNA polymerase III subunit delta [Alkalilimnicola sp. S0819]MPQ15158.1 DNA polymerase III subunit delta [Alkalilimnicola sp. S0819]
MLNPRQLPQQLAQQLSPVYLVAGEEPLLLEEALDAIRAAARKAGHSEREVLEVGTGFDWNRLAEASGSLSLFGDRRILELRIPNSKPGRPGSQAIGDYCARPPEDTVLIISCGRLDASQRKSAWVRKIEQAGTFLYVWPVSGRAFAGWLAQRLRERGLTPSREALALLEQRAEGNLLAAAQEIDKLQLLHGEGPLALEQVQAAVADSARYDVFDLSDAVLAGDPARTLRILHGLRAEGVEPTLVLWTLARDLRLLAELAAEQARRGDPAGVLKRERVWKSRAEQLRTALRGTPASTWETLLARAARADRALKGVGEGRPWDELLQLAILFARAAGAQR